ncbi:DNA translocase FtsK [Bacillus sp. FJAT-42376]|uniref:DNA translocase FtsK n=1 Tax=Bacillus sp. FJAT-42376 TaxID=2014076 RepID=UPI000F50B738|nr:DNA translocase FtsK [Bacillus sp. FJAT-42376]AZB43977.1 DNA translocase FtsK [Bacillus sp. FJAT-42376]
MSWMSKFKQFLFGETEEIVEIVEYVRVDDNEKVEEIKPERKGNETKMPAPNVRASGNQFEAKIAYQYPEGKFRFPAIPDERKRQPRQQRERSASRAEETPKAAGNHIRKPSPPKPGIPRKIEPDPSVPKKPFQPTAIPSPIYGFRQRSEMESLPYKIREKTIAESRKYEEETLRKLSMHSSSFYKKRAAEAAQKQAASDKEEFFAKGTNPIADVPPAVRTEDSQWKPSVTFSMDTERQKNQEPIAMLDLEQDSEDLVKSEDLLKNEDSPQHNESSEESFEPVFMEEAAGIELPEETAGIELPPEEPFYESVYTEETGRDREAAMEETEAELTSDPAAEEIPVSAEPEHKAPVTDKPKPSNVPYNVLMLNRDRNRMKEHVREGSYHFPPIHLLSIPPKEASDDREWLESQRELLDNTLKNFNVRARVVHVTQGPSVTRFEVQPEPGVKVNKITNLSDDIKLSLSAKDIRIEAPIPGKNAIGIEVPNLQSKTVSLREIIRSQEFKNNPSPLTVALGLDISGQPIVTDLKKMPHGLIAGATGSGKSVCINSMLISLLYKAAPHEVKMLLIDPKMVELAPYNRIPHLVSPVITDAKAATGALKWAVEEMERRYELFAHSGVRDINRYNELVKTHKQGEHLPYLVIVIDELADLMMVAPGEVEEAICRIAQKARACGIHLIVATQRPSVDVITGLIKANIPTRIAFSVSSQVDSRTILDVGGAEKLLGRGDMLFLENGTSKHLRVQGNFVSDEEMEQVVAHVKRQMDPVYLFNQEEFLKKSTIQAEEDDLFAEACEFVVTQNGASTSSLQRRFRIGYNRAARLIDMMEEQGIISEAKGSRPRDVLISEDDLLNIQESNLL